MLFLIWLSLSWGLATGGTLRGISKCFLHPHLLPKQEKYVKGASMSRSMSRQQFCPLHFTEAHNGELWWSFGFHRIFYFYPILPFSPLIVGKKRERKSILFKGVALEKNELQANAIKTITTPLPCHQSMCCILWGDSLKGLLQVRHICSLAGWYVTATQMGLIRSVPEMYLAQVQGYPGRWIEVGDRILAAPLPLILHPF